jgi:hypothetical protein
LNKDVPDSVFPNNWFSTHRSEGIPGIFTLLSSIIIIDGLFVLYPMKAQSRENEKNPAFISTERNKYKHFIDLKRHNKD